MKGGERQCHNSSTCPHSSSPPSPRSPSPSGLKRLLFKKSEDGVHRISGIGGRRHRRFGLLHIDQLNQLAEQLPPLRDLQPPRSSRISYQREGAHMNTARAPAAADAACKCCSGCCSGCCCCCCYCLLFVVCVVGCVCVGGLWGWVGTLRVRSGVQFPTSITIGFDSMIEVRSSSATRATKEMISPGSNRPNTPSLWLRDLSLQRHGGTSRKGGLCRSKTVPFSPERTPDTDSR